MQVIRGKRPRPRKCMLYGQNGVGKTTWASQAWDPLFLDLEKGSDDLDVARTPQLLSLESFCAAVAEATSMPEFSTLVVDSLDWLELLIMRAVGKKHGKQHYSEVGFGHADGTLFSTVSYVQQLLDGAVRAGKAIILLAHCQVDKFNNPETDPYDVYKPNLHKKTIGPWQDFCDEVFFAAFEVFVQTKEGDFGREIVRGKGGENRFMRTTRTAACEAKNRVGMKGEYPLSFAEYARHWPKAGEPHHVDQPVEIQQEPLTNGNIAGIVSNGSSKLSNEKTELELEAEKVF